MTNKKIWLIVMIVAYIGAGTYHFIDPAFYLGIMPSWLPEQSTMNALSGIAEIGLALLLLFPGTQRFAAWMIMLMLFVFLVCIHIPMALEFHGWHDLLWWIAIVRLFIQF